MKTKFYIKDKQQKTTSIYAVAHYRGKRYKIPTGEVVKSAYWNKSSQRVKESTRYTDAEKINVRLKSWSELIDSVMDDLTKDVKAPSPEQVKKEIQKRLGEDIVQYDFIAWVRQYIDICNKSNLTIRNYRFTLSVLEQFNRYLKFQDINISFYKAFQTWSDKQGYTLNTFGSFIKHIKHWMNEAEDDLHHGCRGHLHKKFVTVSETADTVYLDLDELIAIRELEITWETVMDYFKLPAHKAGLKAESMNLARDRFLIGAFTGLRVGDFTRISPANVSGGFIKILPQKGALKASEVIIPLHPVVREIMDRIDFSVKVYDTKINKQLKDICRMAGITQQVSVTRTEGGRKLTTWKPKYELITTHTARRSAATNMYKSGIPTLAIMKITGHRTEKSFLKYIKVTAEENAEMLRSHNFFKGI